MNEKTFASSLRVSCAHVSSFLCDRLCGELVCKACTSKLHLPKHFEKKDKELSRVCHQCLFTVLVQRMLKGDLDPQVRIRVQKYVWGPVEPPTVEEKKKLLPRVFFIPDWTDVRGSANCFKCAYVTERRHHCRLCGLLFCGDCSEKLADIPQAFDKKNKSGGKRVCDYCRFCLALGWRCQHPGEKQPTTSEYKIRDGSGQNAVLGYDNSSSSGQNGNGYGNGMRQITNGAGGANGVASRNTPASYGGTTAAPPSTRTPSAPSYGGGGGYNSSVAPSSSSSSSTALRPLSQCSVSTCSSSATVGGMCSTHDVQNSCVSEEHSVWIRGRREVEVGGGCQRREDGTVGTEPNARTCGPPRLA